jgi:hypothetical protein
VIAKRGTAAKIKRRRKIFRENYFAAGATGRIAKNGGTRPARDHGGPTPHADELRADARRVLTDDEIDKTETN